jgi:hypothetical protein
MNRAVRHSLIAACTVAGLASSEVFASDDAGRGFSIGFAPRHVRDGELRASGWFFVCDAFQVSLVWETLRDPGGDDTALKQSLAGLPSLLTFMPEPSYRGLPSPDDVFPSSEARWDLFSFSWKRFDTTEWSEKHQRERPYRFTQLQLHAPTSMFLMPLGLWRPDVVEAGLFGNGD